MAEDRDPDIKAPHLPRVDYHLAQSMVPLKSRILASPKSNIFVFRNYMSSPAVPSSHLGRDFIVAGHVLNSVDPHAIKTGQPVSDSFVFGTGAAHDIITDFDSIADFASIDLGLAVITSAAELPAPVAPPSSYWFEALLPSDAGKDFLMNMEELFHDRWIGLYGVTGAKNMYRIQCAKQVIRHWFGVVVETCEKARKIIY